MGLIFKKIFTLCPVRAQQEIPAPVRHDYTWNLRIWGSLLAVFAVATASAQSLHIFSSIDSEGKTSWATQALDSSYAQVTSLSILTIENKPELTDPTQPIKVNAALAKRRQTWQPLVDSIALQYGVDPAWVAALIEIESSFNPNAVSPKGAIGLMQLMPATAARYGMRDKRELFDPARNLDIGVRHLKDLLALHNGNLALAMASYNAGSGAVAKHGNRIPRFNETMLYVPAVLAAASRTPTASNP